MAKNETVAMSKRNPVNKVRKRVNKPVSTSPKSHAKKLIRTNKEIKRKRRANAFNKAKRFGNNLDHILSVFVVKSRFEI